MPNDIVRVFEEKVVHCKVQLKGVKYRDVNDVKFVFTRVDGKDLAGNEVKATITKSNSLFKSDTGECDWTTAKCGDDELSYEAYYHIEVKGTKYRNFPQIVRVYAKDMTVKVTKDDAKVQGALIRFEQDIPKELNDPRSTTSAVRASDGEGEIKYDLAVPNDVRVRVQRPWLLVSWVTETGRKLEVKATDAYTAKIVTPDLDGRPTPEKGKPLYVVVNGADGPVIKIKVKPTKDTEGRTGQKCYLKAEFDGENSTRTPDDSDCAPGKTKRMETTLDGSREAKFDVPLTHAGADKVKISVGATAECNDDRFTVITERELFYELLYETAMDGVLTSRTLGDGSNGKDLPDEIRNWAGERLARAGVRFTCYKSYRRGYPAGCKYPKAFAGKTGGGTVAILSSGFTSVFSAADPRTIHMTLCDVGVGSSLVRSGGGWEVEYATVVSGTLTAKTVELDMPTLALREAAYGRAGVKDLVWEAVLDPNDVEATHPGLDAGSAKSGALDAACIDWDNSTWVKLKIDLRNDGTVNALVGALDRTTKCPVKIAFKVAKNYEINGNAGGGNQLMVLSRPGKAVACTICHELGHSMGQTVLDGTDFKAPPPYGMPYPSAVPGGLMYEGKGHTGSHCAKGLSGSEKKKASYSGLQGTCIMFGSGGNETEPKRQDFCDECQKYIKGRKLIDVRSEFKDLAERDR